MIKGVDAMKRRITVDQLNELSEEQKVRLREWWKPELGDFYFRVTKDGKIDYIPFVYSKYDDLISNNKEFKIPVLDIGQMIDFMTEHKGRGLLPIDQKGGEVIANKGGKTSPLCDALWEAVKSTL